MNRVRLHKMRNRILKNYGIDLFLQGNTYSPSKVENLRIVKVPTLQFNTMLKIAYNLEAKVDNTFWSLYTASNETGLVRNTIRNYINAGGYFDLPVAGKWIFVNKGQAEYLGFILDSKKKI